MLLLHGLPNSQKTHFHCVDPRLTPPTTYKVLWDERPRDATGRASHIREKSILYPFKNDPVRVNALSTLADVADVRHGMNWEESEKDRV